VPAEKKWGRIEVKSKEMFVQSFKMGDYANIYFALTTAGGWR